MDKFNAPPPFLKRTKVRGRFRAANRKLSDEAEQLAAQMYRDGLTVKQIASQFECSYGCIYYMLLSLGIPIRSRRAADAAEADRLYQAGLNCPAIAQQLGVSRSVALNAIRRHGTAIRPREVRHRYLPLNEAAFDVVTDESAYWGGFLVADGNVSGNKIYLNLKAGDLAHVEAFRSFLGSGHAIRTSWHKQLGKEQVHFAVSSRRLTDALARFGVVPRKSLIADVPKELADNRHWWRGVVDGDGSVILGSSRNKPVARLSLCGSHLIVSKFADLIKSLWPQCQAAVKTAGNIFEFRITGEAAYAGICYLYAGAGMSLARKLTAARDIIARGELQTTHGQVAWNAKYRLITWNGETHPLTVWAERSGLRIDTLWRRLNVYGWTVEMALSTPTIVDRAERTMIRHAGLQHIYTGKTS